jgi:UDP-N-acetylmuramoyl-L-alanyl-D-glutamate--2,6-diaminopimelate ligase
MRLSTLIKQMPALEVAGSLDREVSGITYDSRRVAPGMLFVAIPGQQTDGHQFINNAIERGASAVICEQNGIISSRATKIKVADAREAMAHAAAVFYEHPSARLLTVGVTGTNGKTTVAFMIKQLLEKAGLQTGLIGTVRYKIGERIIPAHRTTPEAVDLQQLLSQMTRAGCRACVMEVSSHALDQKRVAGVEFDVAIFTNLTQDHLDYHGTMEAYYHAKKKLFVENANKKRTAVINIDDHYGQRLERESTLEVRLTFGIDSPATVRAAEIELNKDFTRMNVETPQGDFSCKLPLIGRHNVYNALAAIGAGLALKILPATIQTALESLEPVPGRLEMVSAGQGFGLFVDYAHTDDALRNVLSTLRELTSGRLLLAFGCGGNRDPGKRPKMGKVAAELADFTLVTSDNPRRESPAAIAAQIEEGYRSVRTDGYQIELDRRRAIEEIIRAAKPGDIVLIAGKGHETYQEFEDTVVPFDDRFYAQETLAALGFA